MAINMSIAEIANMIPDDASRTAWIAKGMPTDIDVVAAICIRTREERAVYKPKKRLLKSTKYRKRGEKKHVASPTR